MVERDWDILRKIGGVYFLGDDDSQLMLNLKMWKQNQCYIYILSISCHHTILILGIYDDSANGFPWWLWGPGGLDSDWIPENEREWDSYWHPMRLPNHRGPKPPIYH